MILGYFYVNVSRARYSQPGARQRDAAAGFGAPSLRPFPRLAIFLAAMARPHAGFLIANPRLEIFTSPTKQTIGAKSNRERIAFFPCDSSRDLSAIDFRSEISNRNSRIIRNSPKCRRNNTYAFSNRNKSAYSGIFAGSLSVARWTPNADRRALRRLSASRVNRLESKKKWQSPLKRFGRNQPLTKIS